MDELTDLRKKIDEIDDSLVELFLKRMEITSKVARYKIENNMNVLVKSREEQVIKRHTENIEDEKLKGEVREFLENLMYMSKKAQRELIDSKYCTALQNENVSEYKVGYQGVKGSFSHEALIKYFGEDTKTINFLNFKDVFDALKDDKIKYGVLPVENSSTGSISEVYDLLGKYNFYIAGEKCIKITHNLLGIKGASLSEITEVYSKDQGFLQSSEFFNKYPGWKLIPYYNTAKSAELISREKLKDKACVASKEAARIYDLDILKENINDNDRNFTRFIIISKENHVDERCNKISIAISLPHKPGTLYEVLKNFARNNSNMVKIESRPIANKSWQYMFYIDFTGSLKDSNVKNALKSIENESLYFKFLGNYISEVNNID